MDDKKRYRAALHAMQTGVKLKHGEHGESAKHLRVGVNAAMCDHAALVRMLIAKGLITEAEYLKEIADEMEREVARHEQDLRYSGRLPKQGKLA